MNPLRTYTGLELIQHVKGKPIGVFDQNRIQADIDALGADSEASRAKLDMMRWVSRCMVDLDSLDSSQKAALGSAVKWYAVYRYRRHHIHHVLRKEEVTDEDYRSLHYDAERVVEELDLVSNCLSDFFRREVLKKGADNGLLEDLMGDDDLISC